MKNSQCPSPITVIYSFARVDQHEIWTEQFWVVSSVSSIDQSEKFIFTKFPCRQNCQLPLHRGGVTLGAGNCGDVGREGRSFTYNVRVRYCLDKYQMSLIKKKLLGNRYFNAEYVFKNEWNFPPSVSVKCWNKMTDIIVVSKIDSSQLRGYM